MKSGEFEKISGLSRDTLRYYEKLGLLTPPRRDISGYRCYSEQQLRQVRFITKGKAIGFTLSEIQVGYRQYQEKGHFCPKFIEQLNLKKSKFIQTINESEKAITAITELLGAEH